MISHHQRRTRSYAVDSIKIGTNPSDENYSDEKIEVNTEERIMNKMKVHMKARMRKDTLQLHDQPKKVRQEKSS